MNEDVVRDTHELERSTLRLLLTTELEAIQQLVSSVHSVWNEGDDVLLATLERKLHLVFARGALQPEHNLLRRLRLITTNTTVNRPDDTQGGNNSKRTFLWKTGLV